jgi:hypothetical protein
MLDRIDKPLDRGWLIPCTSGKPGVKIKSWRLEKIKKANLNILPSNHCSKEEDQPKKENYLKDSQPTWEIISFGALVERSDVQDIMADINILSKQKCEDAKSTVQMKKTWHIRGSGASTTGMQVIWKLKK